MRPKEEEGTDCLISWGLVLPGPLCSWGLTAFPVLGFCKIAWFSHISHLLFLKSKTASISCKEKSASTTMMTPRFAWVKELIQTVRREQGLEKEQDSVSFFPKEKMFFCYAENKFKINQNKVQVLELSYFFTFVFSFKFLKYIHIHHFIRFDQYD